MDASANASVKESKFEIVWLFTLEIPVLPTCQVSKTTVSINGGKRTGTRCTHIFAEDNIFLNNPQSVKIERARNSFGTCLKFPSISLSGTMCYEYVQKKTGGLPQLFCAGASLKNGLFSLWEPLLNFAHPVAVPSCFFFWPLYLFDCRMHSAWLACWLVALGTIERRTAFKTCDRQCWMCDIAFVQKAFCTVVNRQKTFYLLVPLVSFRGKSSMWYPE